MMPDVLPRLPSEDMLTRAILSAAGKRYVKKGAWNKADILLVNRNSELFAVKDYAAKSFLVKLIGRFQLTREIKAYERLEDVAGVPRFFGRMDRDAIVIKYVGGIRLPKVHHRLGGVPHVARRLEELLCQVHDRGVIHGDIRSRDNLIVTGRGDLYLIDFSSAMIFDADSWSRRTLFPRLRRAEERALLKWKVALVPHELTSDELAQHRRFKRLRRLWPFNRKKDLPETRGRNPSL